MFENYKLHHVGIVAPSIADAKMFMSLFSLKEEYRGFVQLWSCWCIFTRGAGGTVIELVIPDGGPLARFNKGVGGVHHFAFEVESLSEAMRWAETQGLHMIAPERVKGAGDFWCNFISPVSTRGIQIEFVEPFRR